MLKKRSLYFIYSNVATVLFLSSFSMTVSAKENYRYVPDPTKTYTYIHYEGISTMEFSHVENGVSVWKGVYSYSGDSYFSQHFLEDQKGLLMGYNDGRLYREIAYPIQIGTTWSTGEGDFRSTITSLSKTVKTRAGTFHNVLEIKRSDRTYFYGGHRDRSLVHFFIYEQRDRFLVHPFIGNYIKIP